MNITPLIITILSAGALAATVLLPSESRGAPESDAIKLTAAIREIQAQQTSLAENQTKIEGKVAAIAEEVRIARIYVSRGGSSAK